MSEYNSFTIFISVTSSIALVLTLYFKVRKSIYDLVEKRLTNERQVLNDKINNKIEVIIELINQLDTKINAIKEQQQLYVNTLKDKDKVTENMLMNIKDKIEKMDKDLAKTMSLVDILFKKYNNK